MDDPAASRDELDRSLAFIRFINKRFGGQRALIDELDAAARQRADATAPDPEPLRVLDIGTGSADIPVAAVRWARQRNLPLTVVGLDNHPTTLGLARAFVQRELGVKDPAEAGIELIEADALKLTDLYEPRSFDVVHAGMFLHHLSDIEIATVLRVMDRLARRRMVWNDLVRSRTALLGAHILTTGGTRMVRHDATVSVRAGFTKREALEWITRVGWEKPRVRASFVQQRFVATGEKWHA